MDITGNNEFFTVGGAHNFNNAGMIIKTSASGTTTLGVVTSNIGIIKGVGILNLTNSFTNNGIIAPGSSPGILTINGAQPLSDNSTLQIEMKDGSGPGTGHDQLIRDGNITLSGILVVTETGAVPNGTYTIVNLTAGTVSGNFSTVTLPEGYVLLINASNVQITKNIVLPLTLLSFTGLVQTNDAVLEWKTANEFNVNRFEIERSEEGRNFVKVGAVSPGLNYYTFTDVDIFKKKSISFYRIVSIDVDGKFTHSKIIRLSTQLTNRLAVFPNPIKNLVTISGLKQSGTISLFTTEGKLLKQQIVTAQTVTLDMSRYTHGIYLLQYNQSGEVFNMKIVKE